ncbi:MAG TPA: lysine--tRNA ligase, partial [Caulifigura sp.]|nr:lysine--tRNA ligase [Caulifigura sp.]
MSAPAGVDRLEAARLEKLNRIVELGHDPYGQRFDDHLSIADARAKAPAEAGVIGEPVRVAGRVIRWPKTGKLQFVHIQDLTGRIQLMMSKADLSEPQWELIRALDLGDIVGVDGKLRLTNSGEVTIFVDSICILTKSLAQPPEKFHGAKDMELLLRHREVDLIYTEGVADRLLLRSRIVQSIRQTLKERAFHEVDTPVLHAIAGGAAARPFITHHNALDIPLFLRIALELHLKRLMVGGIERVYEMSRVFRNEGIDATHNPEFTMLEAYQAYGNYESMMDLTEAIVVNAARVVLEHSRPPAEGQTAPAEVDGRLIFPWGDKTIDLTAPWARIKYEDAFREHVGCDMRDQSGVVAAAQKLGIETVGKHDDVLISEVFEAVCEDKLVGPVFLIDYPASICPLTKRKTGDVRVAERFELYIHGMELANAYTELNDPRLQEELFTTQLAGQDAEESMAKMDVDFIKALKVGMPPAGGLGIGIDRLVMLLTNTRSIRDVIAFPLLKPEKAAAP